MKMDVAGVYIAKRVFQLHWVDSLTGEITSVQVKRDKFLLHFVNRPTCLIGMEAAAVLNTGRGNSAA